MTNASLIWIGLFIIGATVLWLFSKTEKFVRCILFSIFSGLSSLFVLWMLGHLININIAVTPLTTAISAILGIPGVVAMLIIRLL